MPLALSRRPAAGRAASRQLREGLDEGAAQLRRRQLRESGAEVSQDPGIDPIGQRHPAGRLGEVPRLARVGDADLEAAVARRAAEPAVHTAGCLRRNPLRRMLPEEARNRPAARAAVFEGALDSPRRRPRRTPCQRRFRRLLSSCPYAPRPAMMRIPVQASIRDAGTGEGGPTTIFSGSQNGVLVGPTRPGGAFRPASPGRLARFGLKKNPSFPQDRATLPLWTVPLELSLFLNI